MVFLSRFFHGLSVGHFVKEATTIVAELERVDIRSRAKLRLAAGFGLITLLVDSGVERAAAFRVAMKTLYEGSCPRNSDIGVLGPYLLHINSLTTRAASLSNPINKIIAVGLPYWSVAIRASYTEELRLHAERIWSLLDGVSESDYLALVDEVSASLHGHPLEVHFPLLLKLESPKFRYRQR